MPRINNLTASKSAPPVKRTATAKRTALKHDPHDAALAVAPAAVSEALGTVALSGTRAQRLELETLLREYLNGRGVYVIFAFHEFFHRLERPDDPDALVSANLSIFADENQHYTWHPLAPDSLVSLLDIFNPNVDQAVITLRVVRTRLPHPAAVRIGVRCQYAEALWHPDKRLSFKLTAPILGHIRNEVAGRIAATDTKIRP